MAGINLQEEDATKIQKIYQDAFEQIISTRGIKADTAETIENSNCVIVVETNEDETVKLPKKLLSFLNEIFKNAKDIYAKKIALSKSIGIIKIGISNNSSWIKSKNEDLLIPLAQNSEESFALSSILVFDLKQGKFKNPLIAADKQKQEILWKNQNFPSYIIGDFTKLLSFIDLKEFSKVSIYRSIKPIIDNASFLKAVNPKFKLRRRRGLFRKRKYKRLFLGFFDYLTI